MKSLPWRKTQTIYVRLYCTRAGYIRAEMSFKHDDGKLADARWGSHSQWLTEVRTLEVPVKFDLSLAIEEPKYGLEK